MQPHVRLSTFVVCALALTTADVTAQSASSCNFAFADPSIQANDVLALAGRRSTKKVASETTAKRGSTIRLGYVVAARLYNSGAIVVKTRHRPAPGTGVTPGGVRVTRASYQSPCEGRAASQYTGSYSQEYDVHGYVDYHRYQFRDATRPPENNLAAYHADIGARPSRECANTGDLDIRLHFMFSRDLTGRQPAGIGAKLRRQGERLAENFRTSTATAEPIDFNAYTAYRAEIIPYRKEAGKLACIAFTVAHVPSTISTEVMIVDADDVLSPFRFPDPQQTRSINWR
jgi:hypothetical protein